MDNDFLFRQIGQNIKLRRTQKNLTQADVCERLECDKRFYQRIEAGHPVTIRTLERVAHALQLPLPHLLSFEKLHLPGDGQVILNLDWGKCTTREVGVGFRDEAGIIKKINSGYKDLTGYSFGDVEEKDVFDVISKESHSILQAHMGQEKLGFSSPYALNYQGKDSTLQIRVQPVPCFSYDGEYVGTLALILPADASISDIQKIIYPFIDSVVNG
jgi:PAS domain S-box-containing protein